MPCLRLSVSDLYLWKFQSGETFLFRESIRNPLFDSTGRVLRTKDPFDFFVLVHGNIPKLTVILRGICFSYEYRFCLAGKCINYVFIEKIKCHKNRVGGTYSKHLPPLYSENNQFTSYLPQSLMAGQHPICRCSHVMRVLHVGI